MAEGRDREFLSPLEEQYIQEVEADGDLDQQLLREKDLAAQRLWAAFQDSATAVAHLFRGLASLFHCRLYSSVHLVLIYPMFTYVGKDFCVLGYAGSSCVQLD